MFFRPEYRLLTVSVRPLSLGKCVRKTTKVGIDYFQPVGLDILVHSPSFVMLLLGLWWDHPSVLG